MRIENTVGVDVEGDLDLRNTTRSGRNARKLELAEKQSLSFVQGTFTFAYLRNFPISWGDGGVTLDEGGHDTTSGLDIK